MSLLFFSFNLRAHKYVYTYQNDSCIINSREIAFLSADSKCQPEDQREVKI